MANGQIPNELKEGQMHLAMELERKDEQIAQLREALRIACLDAWPDNPHWPDLYLKRARSNIDVAVRAAIEQAKEHV